MPVRVGGLEIMRGNRKPRYAQVADELLATIREGRVAIGALLPTEAELCARHRISRHTAREAMRVLERMGLVERRQGSGTRVKARTPAVQFNKAVRSIEDLLQVGAATQLAIRETRLEPVDEEMARLLEVEPGSEAVHLSGLRFQPGVEAPFNATEIYLTPRRQADLDALLDPDRAPAVVLDAVNVRRLSRIEQRFSAVSLRAPEARLLGVKARSAALRALRRYIDVDGRVIAVSISTHPGDRFAYSSVLTHDDRY